MQRLESRVWRLGFGSWGLGWTGNRKYGSLVFRVRGLESWLRSFGCGV